MIIILLMIDAITYMADATPLTAPRACRFSKSSIDSSSNLLAQSVIIYPSMFTVSNGVLLRIIPSFPWIPESNRVP